MTKKKMETMKKRERKRAKMTSLTLLPTRSLQPSKILLKMLSRAYASLKREGKVRGMLAQVKAARSADW